MKSVFFCGSEFLGSSFKLRRQAVSRAHISCAALWEAGSLPPLPEETADGAVEDHGGGVHTLLADALLRFHLRASTHSKKH